MQRKRMLIGKVLIALLVITVSVVMLGCAKKVSLKGQEITVGNFWETWDVNTFQPRTEIEEMEVAWRRKIQSDNGFTMRTVQTAGWGDMLDTVIQEIMSGNPSSGYHVVPDWAFALISQGLAYPISDSKAVNFKNRVGIPGKQTAYNHIVAEVFTFNSKQYAFAIGYGGSQHGGGIYFNKRLFREAGLDPDTPYNMQKDGSWTWENFIDVCKKLTRDIDNDGIIDTYAMSADLSTEILDGIVYSNNANYIVKDGTGRLVNATNRPEFIESLQYARRLMTEGVMMPRPDNSNWDWYWGMFYDEKVAMMMEPEWRRGQLMDRDADWGFVFFPKGPRASTYISGNDENVIIIPSTYSPQEVDQILKAIDLWYMPVTDQWKVGMYPFFRDRRAVDETMAMMIAPDNYAFRGNLLVPGLNRGQIAWNMWWFEGEPAQLVEQVSQNWNALIEDVNYEFFN